MKDLEPQLLKIAKHWAEVRRARLRAPRPTLLSVTHVTRPRSFAFLHQRDELNESIDALEAELDGYKDLVARVTVCATPMDALTLRIHELSTLDRLVFTSVSSILPPPPNTHPHTLYSIQ